jgi:ABC-2 type transport system ATP-binding protein
LKELADVCDRLAVLDKGGLVFESDVAALDAGVTKIQIAFSDDFERDRFADLDVVDFTKQGRVARLIVRGDREEVDRRMRALSPILYEPLSLSLEEVFTLELGKRGVNTFAETESGVSI